MVKFTYYLLQLIILLVAMAIHLKTPQPVSGPRRSARIPKKKVFANEWITEEWEFVMVETEVIRDDCTTKKTELFFPADIKKTTNVLVENESDSSDTPSDGTPIVPNRQSRKRSSSKRVIIYIKKDYFKK